MARAYSRDLRDRVIDVALSGASARQVAARFGIGDAVAIVWVRRARESSERQARKQGQPRWLLHCRRAAMRVTHPGFRRRHVRAA
jgi:transposase